MGLKLHTNLDKSCIYYVSNCTIHKILSGCYAILYFETPGILHVKILYMGEFVDSVMKSNMWYSTKIVVLKLNCGIPPILFL